MRVAGAWFDGRGGSNPFQGGNPLAPQSLNSQFSILNSIPPMRDRQGFHPPGRLFFPFEGVTFLMDARRND